MTKKKNGKLKPKNTERRKRRLQLGQGKSDREENETN